MLVTKHPSSQRRVSELCRRFLKLRKEHDVAVNRMWAGALATNFTDEELALIPDLLCPNDQALMKRIREPRPRRKER
jgi:hypothetical protein